MEETVGTGNIIIGILAALGVILLLAVFFFVVKMVFFSKENE